MDRTYLETFFDRQLITHDSRSFYLRALAAKGWDARQVLAAVSDYLRTPASRRAFDVDLVDRDSEPRLDVRRQPVLAA